MGVMCNNSFLVQVKTEGFSVTTQEIEKIIKKRFGRNASMHVEKYIPPPPKLVYPEKKAGDWSTTIKTKSKMKVDGKLPKGKVYCKDCLYCNTYHEPDCLADPDNYKYEDTWFMKERIRVDPQIKNKNNDCKDFIDRHED